MPTSAIQSKPVQFPPIAPADLLVHKPISWENFQRRYLSREDGFKYEWVGGSVEKTKRSMDKKQLFILWNLLDWFDQSKSEGKVSGRLIAEPDLFFLKNHRRPDIAWLTKAQTFALAEESGYQVPAFIIEVVSTNDQINSVRGKMVNYRDAGVQVVWQVLPNFEQVDVYSGPNLDKMTIRSGDAICSAAPALPGFEVPASAIFERNA